jgi:hypothetical protein
MYIYKTTNKITGQYYIGKHVGNNPGYLGSGVYLKAAIKKYGKENFEKVILQECASKKELDLAEKKWIAEYGAVQDFQSYNLAEGGEGGFMLTSDQVQQRVDKVYGEKLTPPPGAVVGRLENLKYKPCVIFKNGEIMPRTYTVHQAAKEIGVTYWTLWHYMKTGDFTAGNYFVDFLYTTYYLINNQQYTDTAQILDEHKITPGTLSHRCLYSDRYDWWKIQKVKEKYQKYIGIFSK